MQVQLTISSRDVVALPVKIRKAMGFQANNQLVAETTPKGLMLRAAIPSPVGMYTPAPMREFDAAEAELKLPSRRTLAA